MGHIKLNKPFELFAGNVTVFGEFSQKLKDNKKAAALGTTPLALILSACGSDTATTTSSSTLLTLTKSADTYSASAVTGFTVADSSTAKFDVADATSNAYQIKLDATGTGVLEFDFADAGDTVTLEAGSKSSGFTTLKVTDGTLDATNADLTGITRVEVASGIKISLAQIKEIPTLVASSATSEITVEVTTEAEATELVSLIAAGTVTVFADTNPIKLVAAATATIATETLTAKQTETTASVKPAAEAPADTAVADTTTDTGTSTGTDDTTTDTSTTTDTGTTTGGTSGGGGGGASGPTFSIIQSGVGAYIVGTTNGNVTASDYGDLVTFTPTTGVAVNKLAADITSLRVDDITLTTTAVMASGLTVSGNGNITLTASDGAQTISGLTTTGTHIIDVGAGADTVTVATGTNTITTGAGADTINVSTTSGTQTINVTSENGVTNLINATGAGATYVVNLAGTTAGTVTDASGSSQTVTITGTTAADTFEGGTGADAFVGLAGDDIYVFDGTAQVASGESITEASSAGTDTVKLIDTTSFANMTAGSFDEIDQIEIVGAKTGTFTGAQLTGETIALLGGTGIQAVVIGATGGGTTDLSGISAGTGWTAGTDTITIGGADGTAEVITGTATNDSIDAGNGNDTVNGGAGADAITMGTGTDTVAISSVVGTSSGSVSSAGSGSNDDVGTDTVSELLFASGTDVVKIVATNVDSFVHATDTDIGLGTGTDTAGTAAAYTILTGLIDLNQANNNVYTDAGDIVVTFVATDTFSEANFEGHLAYDLTADTDGTTGITGGALADTLTGGAGADTLTGGAGNDTLSGAGGADTLDGGTGDDTLVVTSDSTSESYTGGDDTDTLQIDVAANLSNDTLATLEVLDLHEDGTAVAVTMTDAQVDGFTTIKAAASAIGTGDIITLSDAMTSDMLDGTTIGAGTDADEVVFVLFDAANALTVHDNTLANAGDTLYIDGSNLTGSNALTFNGSGETTATVILTATGGAAADALTGGASVDVLSGGGGGDTLIGGAGADTLNGDAGTDTLTGGTGIDTLTGGADADSFIYTDIILAANANNIADFLGDGTGQDLLKFDNDELGGISSSAAGATANTAVVASALSDTASATIDAAIDGATGTTTGQQIVIIAGGVSGGGVATAAELEAGAAASDLTGAGYFVIADSVTAGRVFYDANFASGTDGTGFIQVATLTGTLLTSMSVDSVAIL